MVKSIFNMHIEGIKHSCASCGVNLSASFFRLRASAPPRALCQNRPSEWRHVVLFDCDEGAIWWWDKQRLQCRPLLVLPPTSSECWQPVTAVLQTYWRGRSSPAQHWHRRTEGRSPSVPRYPGPSWRCCNTNASRRWEISVQSLKVALAFLP